MFGASNHSYLENLRVLVTYSGFRSENAPFGDCGVLFRRKFIPTE